ncbi:MULTISPECIES: histidine kinase N-terminal 7TM domain-containing diguanylate cyclase [Paenibacillus]|uniref:histidine kinase N-terminal 7TM domain-containing diguanylate cyclase n=1 Tax=Paenibacillus TaxID=44249 RepID=UPI00204262D1|nr:diguanylate cyclase [Paenibacillus camelliae]MCM3633812.1 diguanylate cyclase [Paenibacillus camelliae]
MGLSMIIDFGIFLVLLGTLIFLIFTKTISILNRVYLSLHLGFMFWALLQFAAGTTAHIEYRFLFIKLSYVALSSLGVGSLVFTLYIINRSSFLKSTSFKLAVLPNIAANLFILWNPNGYFLTLNQDLSSDKAFIYGKFFGIVIALLMIYVSTSILLLIRSYFHSKQNSMVRYVCRFALIGIGIILGFGCVDLILNIIYLQLMETYIPILSVGMLLSALYMSINVNRMNVLDIISIAHRDVMNTISVGILVLDRDEHIVEMNRFVDEILPFKIGERFELEKVKEQLPANNWSIIEKKLKQREVDPFIKLEFQWTIIEPEERSLLVQSYPIVGKRARLMGYMFTLQDLTEVNRLADSLKRQNLLLQQRNNELIKTQEDLYEANRKLEEIAVTDALTECYNRRYLMQFLEVELVKNIKEQLPFTIIIFDLDYFKLINDAYGHLNGDTVLVHTARKVKSLLGSKDRLARYGGEEFIVYMPELSALEAHRKAEQIKNEIENQLVWIEDAEDHISVTISVGIVTIDNYEQFKVTDSKVFLQEIMNLADTALYEAKYKGRNLIVNRSTAIS